MYIIEGNKMVIKKCKNCMEITEHANGMCVKCGHREAEMTANERIATEQKENAQRIETQVQSEQRKEVQAQGAQSRNGSAPAMQSNISYIWYNVAYWLPFVGFQFAAALLSRGEVMEGEKFLRTAFRGFKCICGIAIGMGIPLVLFIVFYGIIELGWA